MLCLSNKSFKIHLLYSVELQHTLLSYNTPYLVEKTRKNYKKKNLEACNVQHHTEGSQFFRGVSLQDFFFFNGKDISTNEE